MHQEPRALLSSAQPDPAMDGISHINVYSKGRTRLGQLLSNFARTPFVVDGFGRFASVEAYWYWLSCEQDELRDLAGFEAKAQGRRLIKERGRKPRADFENLIRAAVQAKIEQHPEIQDLLRKAPGGIPLLHYYVYGDQLRDVSRSHPWLMECLEQVRVHARRSLAPTRVQDPGGVGVNVGPGSRFCPDQVRGLTDRQYLQWLCEQLSRDNGLLRALVALQGETLLCPQALAPARVLPAWLDGVGASESVQAELEI
ncbi:NADAR family protein [Thioalkalivibrio thiocyanodenitrificans]|uniref:NADAR family protein n=1 Tax=Thioalkalivibrio thiocyanodenitrificans TaxID=243063 RepID=UPI0003A8BE95|nr:NADAR family protein [Thioalkalivibrio thiocyanodenitrificans]